MFEEERRAIWLGNFFGLMVLSQVRVTIGCMLEVDWIRGVSVTGLDSVGLEIG